MLRKKIKNLSEIFGSFADNFYFCNQIEDMGRLLCLSCCQISNPKTGLYFQSSGYVYSFLIEEIG